MRAKFFSFKTDLRYKPDKASLKDNCIVMPGISNHSMVLKNICLIYKTSLNTYLCTSCEKKVKAFKDDLTTCNSHSCYDFAYLTT